ncbi:MAG TPA: TatD family nuclease-associated radical SAM protein [Candidatus Wallbacteria bacterium]|nr:TatD family nuclease-associated radical SAM protein [Candidatus Wallbacteria bacterium]
MPIKSDKKPVYAYVIKNSIYINTTVRCSNVCDFCIKFFDSGVAGYDLTLAQDPQLEETCDQIDALLTPQIESIVFCGMGESTYRLEFMEKIAEKYNGRGLKFRLNTNGHGNLINKCDIVPRLSKFLNTISISLNAHNKAEYDRLCNPAFENAYEAMLDFAASCVSQIEEVYLTVVEMPGVDIEKCRAIADKLKAKFRIRPYIPVPATGGKCETECQK